MLRQKCKPECLVQETSKKNKESEKAEQFRGTVRGNPLACLKLEQDVATELEWDCLGKYISCK